MANDEVLGPRKTMFVLVIVVGCFAVLWPRILSPLLLGPSRDQLKPNKFDKDAGCCEVIFETEMAALELVNEVCSSVVGADGKLSPYAAAECRRTVNETCGLDIAAFLKRSENVGKSTKILLETMKNTNSSCLKEHFGVPVWSLSTHIPVSSWVQQDSYTVKQERPPFRGAGPHPALRERGRAIPPGAAVPPPRATVMPPHVRVRSPLNVYLEVDVQPPPIPGMRPPLGSPGGPVSAPKSSMGFVMPIYTLCIIVFFVYTLSKILFKRTESSGYEQVTPDPQFRRRVFRDNSRSSPETKLVVNAISGLVAEVQQQMEASYAQNQQRQEAQDNQARPYTNGTVLVDNAPVQIVASEYREPSKDKSPEPQKEPTPEPQREPPAELIKEPSPEPEKEPTPDHLKELTPEPETEAANETTLEPSLSKYADNGDIVKLASDEKETPPEFVGESKEPEEVSPKKLTSGSEESIPELLQEQKDKEPSPAEEIEVELSEEEVEEEEEEEEVVEDEIDSKPKANGHAIKLSEAVDTIKDSVAKDTQSFLQEEKANLKQETVEKSSNKDVRTEKDEKQSTPELLEEALREDSPEDDDEEEVIENKSVKVMGVELRTHSADLSTCAPPARPRPQPRLTPEPQVKSIFLETEIPQQSRVMVTDFAEEKPAASKHSQLVVSGKMTLSLIQDAPRESPDRDPESTFDDFTTASGVTQPAGEKDEEEEESEEEIEIEEIEEEIEIEEDEDEDEPHENK